VFARRREDPAFGGALLVLFLISLVLGVVFHSAFEPLLEADLRRGFQEALRQNPQLKPEMVEQSVAVGKKFFLVGVGGLALIIPMLLGFVVWLVGKVVDSKAGLAHGMMVATYAMFPRIIETVVNALQALLLPDESLKGQLSVKLGVGRFLNPDTSNPILLALLGRVDLFTFWVTTIIAIGIAVTGKVPKGRAALAGILVWVVGGLPALWGAVRQMG
jgi:hypothetical protein